MNKLKWVPLHKELNLNVPALLSDKHISMLISSSNANDHENYVKMFYIGNDVILCFVWGKIIVLELNQSNNKFSLEMIYCTTMNHLSYSNEYVTGIKQISAHNGSPNKFAMLTNHNNVYCIDVSLVDYYVELEYKVQIQVALVKHAVTLCQYYNKDTFIVIHDNAIYVYELSDKNKKLIYNCNSVSSDEVVLHGEVALDYIVVYTSRNILLLNRQTFSLMKRIFTYEQPTAHAFKGKVFENKIIYIKANDEFAMYDIHNTANNQSLKLSSKKILNKFNFHNVIYVNDDVICLVNDSKSELYVYLQNIPSMNRESTIYDNRNYIVTESHILIIGMNTKKLLIKAKIAKYREHNKQSQPIKANEKEISFPSLKDIENDYEHKHKALQKVKHEIKLTSTKISSIINWMRTRISESQYYSSKRHIENFLIIIYNLYYSLHNSHINAFMSLLNKVQCNLTLCFVANFGSHSLILNYKHVYVSHYINVSVMEINNLISIAIDSCDYRTYISLVRLRCELNNTLQ